MLLLGNRIILFPYFTFSLFLSLSLSLFLFSIPQAIFELAILLIQSFSAGIISVILMSCFKTCFSNFGFNSVHLSVSFDSASPAPQHMQPRSQAISSMKSMFNGRHLYNLFNEFYLPSPIRTNMYLVFYV